MIDLAGFKILKFKYPFTTEELGEMIWDKMTEKEAKWAVKLTLSGVNDTGDDGKNSWDTFFLDDRLKNKIEEILNKYNVPYEIEDQTNLIETNVEIFSEELIEKLYNFLDQNLSVDDILDNILEVGQEKMTVFEKFFLKKNVNQRSDE